MLNTFSGSPVFVLGSGKKILKPEPLILLGDQFTLLISRENSRLKINLMFAFSWNISRKHVETAQIAIIFSKNL